MLGLWDRNPIKLDCDDHCTNTNVIIHRVIKKEKIRKEKKRKCGTHTQWNITQPKTDAIVPFAITGMDLGIIILSEIS